MPRITEEQLILPALYLMDISPNKNITTTAMEEDFARCEKLSNGGTWKIRLNVDVIKIDD